MTCQLGHYVRFLWTNIFRYKEAQKALFYQYNWKHYFQRIKMCILHELTVNPSTTRMYPPK